MSENQNPKIIIKGCYSTGTVKAGDNSKYTGGFIGGIAASPDTEVIIENSAAEGGVIAGENAEHVGAFIGGINYHTKVEVQLLEHISRLLAEATKTNFDPVIKTVITQQTLLLQDKVTDKSLTPKEAGRLATVYESLKQKIPPFLSISADIAQIISLLALFASKAN